MKLIARNDNGKLYIDTLGLDVMFGDLFDNCKTESEIEFVKDAIIGSVENVAEDFLDELN